MSGSRKEIARAIANSILDTLGNNDFVNVFRFSETTEEIVPCFKDLLVQVRGNEKENLQNFLMSLRTRFPRFNIR